MVIKTGSYHISIDQSGFLLSFDEQELDVTATITIYAFVHK